MPAIDPPLPSPSAIRLALHGAFAATLRNLSADHAERSQKWVENLAAELRALEAWKEARVLNKIWGQNKSSLDSGEFLTDIAVVEVATTAGVTARAMGRPEEGTRYAYARRFLCAVESEFEPNTPDWLDDLSKLVVVNAPLRLFVASRAGAGVRDDLMEAQLKLFAEVVSGIEGGRFMLALMPHPNKWGASSASSLEVFVFIGGEWLAVRSDARAA